jgi:MFS family permease
MGLFQALTFAYVSILPGVFLKSIGAPNSMVGLASLFYLPVALRFLVGSIVDRHGSKRLWSLWTQIAQVLVAALSGALILAGAPVSWVLVCFGLASIVGAFLDLSNDGFFLVGTPADRKAFFATLKVQAFRIGNAIAQGGYVMAGVSFLSCTRASCWRWLFGIFSRIRGCRTTSQTVVTPADPSRGSKRSFWSCFVIPACGGCWAIWPSTGRVNPCCQP